MRAVKLERMRQLCQRLGEPQRRFRTVLVAGTNGKGSISAMLYAMLRASPLHVGLYTSPHLENLRISIENYALITRTQDRRQSEREYEDRRSTTAGDSDKRAGAIGENADPEPLSVTVSIGVAERNRRLHTSAAVIRAADEALYRAKQTGRNKVNR